MANGAAGQGSKEALNHHATVKLGESHLDLYGYKTNLMKTLFYYLISIFTLGIGRLLLHWKEQWYVNVRAEKCSLEEADMLLIIDENQTISHRIVRSFHQNRDSEPLVLPNGIGGYDEVSHIRYFTFRKMLYAWFEKEGKFIPPSSFDSLGPVKALVDRINDTRGLSDKEVSQRQVTYGKNLIEVKPKPIVVLLFKEAISPFYIFQLFSVSLWYWDEYIYYATVIVVISLGSITLDVYQTRSQETKLRKMVHSSDEITAIRSDGQHGVVDSSELVPGDVIVVGQGKSVMQCDAILLTGTVIVNESMLTGESVPVTKVNASGLDDANEEGLVRLDFERHAKHVLFSVRALVIRTAFSTTKGQLVRSIMYPKPIDFEFNRDLLKFVGFLCIMASFGFAYTLAIMTSHHADWKKLVIRSLDLITCVVPPALPAAMSVGIINAHRRLKKKNIYCISPSTINTCGAVNVVCFDKTGTLTEDGLAFHAARPILPKKPNQKKPSFGLDTCEMEPVDFPKGAELIKASAVCQSLTWIDGELHGDPLDLILFNETKWRFEESKGDDAEDKRHASVVRPPDGDTATYDEQAYPVIRQFTFSSALQRMSVIVSTDTDEEQGKCEIFVKGSPEIIESLCDPNTVPEEYQKVVNSYAQRGYRLIAAAKRVLNLNRADALKIPRQEVESQLQLLGLIVMENRVKPVTRVVIQHLNSALIRTVMVTGDNLLTAMSVAAECAILRVDRKAYLIEHLPDEKDEHGRSVLVVKEKNHPEHENFIPSKYLGMDEIEQMLTPDYQFSIAGSTLSVIIKEYPELLDNLMTVCDVFARMAPEQKLMLVTHLQSLDHTVAMCGDGANDCAALKAAHAGISLSDAEASIAAPFTSNINDIRCVPMVIREGRAALVTSFGVFKYMANYSLNQFVTVMLVYYHLGAVPDLQFLYIDLFLVTFIALFFGNTGPSDYLSKDPPPIKLLSLASMTSVAGIMAIFGVVQVYIYAWTSEQPWFFMSILQEGYQKDHLLAHQNTTIFCVSLFQYIILAFLYSKGAPYRMSIMSNYLLCLAIAVTGAVSLVVILCPPKIFIDGLEFDPIPHFIDRLFILFTSLACCGVAYIFNKFFVEYFLQVRVDKYRKLKKLKNPGDDLPKWERNMLNIATSLGWISGTAQISEKIEENLKITKRRATFLLEKENEEAV
ncbi:unnamed protein product, partial [Mesorhabditis spiculigera]